MAAGVISWLHTTERFFRPSSFALFMSTAVCGVVVSKPMAKKTTALCGFSCAMPIASRQEMRAKRQVVEGVISQIKERKAFVENQYKRAVSREGNIKAQRLVVGGGL